MPSVNTLDLSSIIKRLLSEQAKTYNGIQESGVILTPRGPSRTVRSAFEDGQGLSFETLEPLRRAYLKAQGPSLLLHTHPEGSFPAMSNGDLDVWKDWQARGSQPLGMGVVMQGTRSPLYTLWKEAKPPVDEVAGMLSLQDMPREGMRKLGAMADNIRDASGSPFWDADDSLFWSALGSQRMADKGLLDYSTRLPPRIDNGFKNLAKRYPLKEARGGLVHLAGGGRVLRRLSPRAAADEVSPLAQAIATRMVGQLEAVKNLPGLSALDRVNLPAAYAGDQRSLQAAQRAISAAENGGLESPGRRKVLKQAAATAARQAVPEVVDTALAAVARGAVKDAVAPAAEIPLESLQAAVSQAFSRALKTKVPETSLTWEDLAWQGNDKPYLEVEELLSMPDAELQKLVMSVLGEEDAASIPTMASVRKMLKPYLELTPESIAQKSGLPLDAVQRHMRQGTLRDVFDEWKNGQSNLESFYDNTGKHQFYDYGFDEFPIGHPDFEKAVGEVVGNEDYDPLYELHRQHSTSAPYEEHLFGPHLDKLEKVKGSFVPTRMQRQEMYDSAGDSFWDRVADMINNVVDEHAK